MNQTVTKTQQLLNTIHRYPTVMALCVLYLPILIFIGPMLLPDGYLFKGDVSFNFAPFTYAGMELWKQGNIPFWTHLNQCGYPLLADGMGALLYPPLILVCLLLPSSVAYNADVAVHVILAALFMFLYCKSITKQNSGAVLGSWIWIFAGPIVGYMGSPALHGLAWIPLIFLLIDRMFKKKKMYAAIPLLSLAYGAGWLGGLPQIPIYSSMASAGYLLFRLWERRNSGIRYLAVTFGGWSIAVILGIGIGAVQLLPTLEAGTQSLRAGGVDYSFATFGSLFPAGIAGFLFPAWTQLAGYWLSGPAIFVGYISIGILFLTFSRKHSTREIYFFWLLLFIGCFLSFGKFNPLYKLIYQIPGLHFLRVPSRFLLFAQFSMAVLSAIGLSALCNSSNYNENRTKVITLFRSIACCLAASLALMVSGTIVLKIARQPLFDYAQKYVARATAASVYALQDSQFYLKRITTMFNDLHAAINPTHPSMIISTVATLGGLLVMLLWFKKRGVFNIRYPLLIFCMVNLLVFVPDPVSALRAKRAPDAPLTVYLKNRSGLFRIYNLIYRENIESDKWAEAKLAPSFNMFHNIDNVGAYSSLGSKRYYDFMGSLGSVNLAFGVPAVTDSIAGNHKVILDLLNVKYITTDHELSIPGLTRSAVDGPPFLYENSTVFPRAFIVPVAKVFSNPDSLLNALHSEEFNPKEHVFLEEQPVQLPNRPITGTLPLPTIISYENTNVVIDATGPGWLVVTDYLYPGWKAAINGKQEKIYRANYVFRALPLKPGKNSVVFTYTSQSFKKGLILCTIALVLCISLVLVQKAPSFATKKYPLSGK